MATIGAQADYGLIRPLETALDRQAKVAQIRQANQQYRLAEAQAYDDDRKKKSLAELMQNSRDPATGEVNKEAIIQGAYGIDPNLGVKLDQQWTPEIEAKKRKAAIQNAYKGSIKGDGTYDENALFKNLMEVDPDLANSAVTKIRENFSSLLKNDLERKSLLVNPLSAVKDENDYESIKAMARITGIGNSDLPDEYDPEAVKKYIEKYKDPVAKHKEFEDAMAVRKQKNEEKNTTINQGKLDEEIRSNKANESTARTNSQAAMLNAQKNNAVPKSFEGGKPVPAESAKALGLISSGMEGAQTFHDALTKGDANFWTTSMIGNFTNPDARIAFDKMTESLGRLNSGGAITKDEEKRFVRMLADKKNLVTEQGRKAIITELEKFINRGKATGNLIYGSEGWQNEFSVGRKPQSNSDNDPLGIR